MQFAAFQFSISFLYWVSVWCLYIFFLWVSVCVLIPILSLGVNIFCNTNSFIGCQCMLLYRVFQFISVLQDFPCNVIDMKDSFSGEITFLIDNIKIKHGIHFSFISEAYFYQKVMIKLEMKTAQTCLFVVTLLSLFFRLGSIGV